MTETTTHIHRSGSGPAERPPEEGFVGHVEVRGYFRRDAPSRLAGATVGFAPGARTPWKTNPLGQTVVVTSGVGWAQCEGGEVVAISAGDVVWFPPSCRYWEGAAPDRAMTYVALHEAKDGRTVELGEKVTDEDYLKGSSGDRPQR